MLYKDYLQSNHWKLFRFKVLQIRNKCQNCGNPKSLNLHHKHYRCLGKETDKDIIVLCQPCHNSFHQKKKWKKKYKQGQKLDFTGANIKNKEFYERSDTLRLCVRCAEQHPVFYVRFINDSFSLAMACPNSKPRTIFIKKENDLDLPIYESRTRKKSLQRLKNAAQ